MELNNQPTHHHLKGINGNSFLKLSIINVSQVSEISYHKRLFSIFNRDYPYTLTIKYDVPSLIPIKITSGESGVYGGVCEVKKLHYITKRYKNASECEEEIQKISEKKSFLQSGTL